MSDLLTNLSSVQKDAVTTCDVDLIVDAGAGAGKTRVLVSRYLHFYVDKGLGLNEILAITFTEKAAAEMQDRVRAKLIELGSDPEGLDTAYISTFHSFCLRILREFPALVGLDPEFGVLDDLRSRVLLYQAVRGEIEKGLASSPPDEDLARLAAGLVRGVPSKLIAVLTTAYNHWRESGLPLTEVISRSREWDPDRLKQATERVSQAVKALAAERDRAPKQAREKLDCLVAHWHSGEELLERAAGLLEFDSKAKDIAPYFSAVHEAAKELVAEEASRAAGPVAESLGRYLERVHAAYSALKERENALDFADLMLIARQLFAHPVVRDSLSRRFKAVLVDEYQDTNGLQKELVDLIRAPRTLFVVGDPKQSIYRFRGAEVEVFAQTASEITGRGGRQIHLDENYRSRGELLDFQNTFFNRLFPAHSPGAISYQRIRSIRPTSHIPRVELLTGYCDQNSPENRAAEAKAIAYRIKELVETGERLAWTTDGRSGEEQTRPIQYGDIAILFRSRTDISIYYEALLQAGIRTINLAGSDFFVRREVADVLACLRAIANPEDELSLAVALRSPLFGLSDPELWQVKTEFGSFAQAVAVDAPTGLICPPGLAELKRLLTDLHPLTLRTGPVFFVDKVLSATDYPQVVLAGSGGVQGYANLRKFQELVAELEQAGLTDLEAFLDYITEITHTSGRESEAQLATEGENAVRLMTIHASKGLEFPVVFVVDGCRGIREAGFPPVVRFNKEEGFGFRLMVGEKTYPTAQYEHIQRWDALSDYEEAKRIFYVAVTRARDYLVLSGIAKKDRTEKLGSVQEANNWLEWLHLVAADFPTVWQRDIFEYLAEQEVVEPEVITETAVTTLAAQEPTVAQTYTVDWDKEMISTGVSDLLLLNSCPRRFYYRRILALPERSFLSRNNSTAKVSGVDPIMRGNLAHLICAQLTEDAPIEDLLVAGASELGVPVAERGALISEVRPLIEAYKESELFARLATSVRTASEEPFLINLAGLTINGTFDKVAFFNDGSGLLIDYKTNRITADEVGAKTAYYQLQLQLYAAAVREKFGLEKLEVGIYFLVPGVYAAVAEGSRAELGEKIGEFRPYLIPSELSSYPRKLGECEVCPYRGYCR